MEIKDVIEDLKVVNDINQMSLDELINAYLSNKEKFNDFHNHFYRYFMLNSQYQLRTIDNYNKINNLYSFGNMLYQSNDKEKIKILNKMNYNIDNYEIKEYINAKQLFMYNIGATKTKSDEEYDQILPKIVLSAELYEKNNGNSIRNFEEFMFYARCNSNYSKTIEAIDKYYKEHPLLYQCNNINFLYFANLMFSSHSSVVTREFVNDVKEVIDTSKAKRTLDPLMIEEQSIKDYNQVAKFTLKNIKDWEKQHKKNYKYTKKLKK